MVVVVIMISVWKVTLTVIDYRLLLSGATINQRNYFVNRLSFQTFFQDKFQTFGGFSFLNEDLLHTFVIYDHK